MQPAVKGFSLLKIITFKKNYKQPILNITSYFSFSTIKAKSSENNISHNEYKLASALFDGLQNGDRSSLARSITLVETQHPQKKAEAQFLLSLVLKKAKSHNQNVGKRGLSFRIGLTGPPGAGKSTFIEALGNRLTSQGHKVAVLAVDPSSSTTGGSLLGDKTRMPELSRNPNAYVRPSPASGCLGGVTRSTNEAIALCESAGFDVIIVETVGVGQSEFHVSYMVDLFAMIVSPAGGDELQGLKKGIVELVDMVIVNKADGDLLPSARRIQADYISALKFVCRRFSVWRPLVLCISSRTEDGIDNLWKEMLNFKNTLQDSGDFVRKRQEQYNMWMWIHIEYNLLLAFKKHPHVRALVFDMERKVQEGIITPGQASDILLDTFLSKI